MGPGSKLPEADVHISCMITCTEVRCSPGDKRHAPRRCTRETFRDDGSPILYAGSRITGATVAFQTWYCSVAVRFIPHSGYFSPEAIVTSLSVSSTTLEHLEIQFQSPQSRPDRNSRRPPLPTRALFPVLTVLEFEGASEYLEDLVAQIDTPLLHRFQITFFHQRTFDIPQLTLFLSRTPTFKEARVVFTKDVLVTPRTFDRTFTFNLYIIVGDRRDG